MNFISFSILLVFFSSFKNSSQHHRTYITFHTQNIVVRFLHQVLGEQNVSTVFLCVYELTIVSNNGLDMCVQLYASIRRFRNAILNGDKRQFSEFKIPFIERDVKGNADFHYKDGIRD